MKNLKSGLEFIFSSYKRTAAIFFIGALVLAIPITITLLGQRQDIRQRAAIALIPGCGSLGDVNGDGKVDSVDANLLLQYTAGKIPISGIVAANSDVNRNGKIDSVDANLILQYSAGLISTFTGCSTSPTPTPTTPPKVTGTICDSAACGKYGAICCPGSSSCIAWWQDNSNCGACGNKCSAGTTCQLNVPGNYTQGASCKSTGGQTSPTPTRAPTGSLTCGDGICQNIVCLAIGCPNPETPQTCPQDCSTSPTPTTCTTPNILCGTSCVYIATDPNNCGACSRACTSGQQCRDGICVVPTTTATPTGIPSGTSNLSVTITLTGIGVSQNPALGINNNPKRSERNVEVRIVNSGNQQVDLTKSTVNYDSKTGKYRGNVSLGDRFISGSYLVKVRLDNTLWKTIPGIQNITSGQIYNAPETALVTGDIIQDNEINLLDYNALLSCYGNKACATKIQADVNDDDKVDELDINILYAGFAKRVGD